MTITGVDRFPGAGIVGYISELGYLVCAACYSGPNIGKWGRQALGAYPVRTGCTHADEPCDICGKVCQLN
jgi:hypothetical protein